MEVQMRIVFFFIVMISSAAEEVKNLTGTEGANITIPDPLVEFGFLSFRGKTIAGVNSREVEIYEDIYKNRLHWDKNTGLFIITVLQRNDSGVYAIDSKKGIKFFTSYKLTVYESVATPAVNISRLSTDSCIFLCFVEKAEETTLLWYKDEEILNQSSSALSLPLTVHKQDFNSPYRCVAANPAENKTLPVNIPTSCSEQNDTNNRGITNTRHYIWTGVIIFFILSVVALGIITKKCLNKTKTTARQTQDSVDRYTEALYTDIQISDNSQAGNLPDSSGTVDRSNLTTVYDKLMVYRILPIHTDTAGNVSDQLSPHSNCAENH